MEEFDPKARLNRVFNLPQELIDVLDRQPVNRSSVVALAIMSAHKAPDVLGKALNRRIKKKVRTSPERVKVGASLSPKVVVMLEELSEISQLPIEQALRLILEAHVDT